jgi:glycosyltransferase involved in cell wall biosynthesis
MSISVIIIGRNAEALLKANYLNRKIDELSFASEVIFVDSDSTDSTVQLAQSFGWKVVQLSSSGRLSAAAGRNIGTSIATGDWLLFLDCDMVFQVDAPYTLPQLIAGIADDPKSVGLVGDTIDVYLDGVHRRRGRKDMEGKTVNYFGGFVLLKREILLRIGNWNPNVIANEENELYARILKHGYSVIYTNKISNLHYTDNPKRALMLLYVYLPLTKKAQKFYGASGMALRAAMNSGSADIFLSRFNSEAVALFIAVIATIIVALLPVATLFKLGFGLVSLLLVALWTKRTRNLPFLLILPSIVLQLVVGVFRYREKKVITREV